MLNEQKIKKMNKLAAYEAGEGKEHLAISNYYRSDYIGLALIKNFFSYHHGLWTAPVRMGRI